MILKVVPGKGGGCREGSEKVKKVKRMRRT